MEQIAVYFIHQMRFASPLRYPGGKACLTGFLTDVIEMNDLRGGAYYEPYAGGAGAALSLFGTAWCLKFTSMMPMSG